MELTNVHKNHLIYIDFDMSEHKFIVTDHDNNVLSTFKTQDEALDWINEQVFMSGYLCAVQNLIASAPGQYMLAARIIRESNMPEEVFRQLQEESEFQTKEMEEVFNIAFEK